MKSRLMLGAASTLVAAGALVALAQADTTLQFEAQPCLITLEPAYTANSGGGLTVNVPPSAVSCPVPGVFDLSTALSVTLVGPNGGFMNLGTGDVTTFEPAANQLVTKRVLRLTGYAGESPSVFSSVADDLLGAGSFYLTDPSTNRNYRLQLARPFSVTKTIGPDPSCVANVPTKLAVRWGAPAYFVLPPTAISCVGFAFTPSIADANLMFDSRLQNQGWLYVSSQTVRNPTTGVYSTTREIRVTSYDASEQSSTVAARENAVIGGGKGSGGSGGWVFGRFTASPDGGTVSPNLRSGTADALRLTPANPFTIKRATDVTAKARRTAAGNLRVNITADRNASFQNTVAPTYRRQTVLPATPADHAIVKRGSTVVKRVKLSVYGKGSVVIPDAPGRNPYTVTMVETNDNFAGTARFVG